jgi:hypothetical protein
LLAHELGPEVGIPTGATVNRWALEFSWSARADGLVLQTRGRTLRELRGGLLASVALAKDALLDGLSGGLDDLPPHAVGARLKSAELALRAAERSGLLALLASAPDTSDAEGDVRDLSVSQRARRMREHIAQENGGD